MFYFKLYDSFAFRYYIRIMNICSKIIINIISFSFLLCISEPLIDYKQNKTYQIFKISSNDGLTAPIIDGVLDDDIWTNKNIITIEDFVQQEPNLNHNPTYKTEVKLVYDEESIYVYAKLYHDNPKDIAQHLCRRDDWMQCFENTSDWFTFDIDPLHNHNSGYIFAVNAAGVQLDALVIDDVDYDGEWNGNWFSEVSINHDGWSVEMEIPFSNLNFNADNNSVWGLHFSRYIKSLNETISWVVIPRHLDGIASKFGHLSNISLSSSNKKIQIRPYISSGIDYFDNIQLNEEYKVEPSDTSFQTYKFNNQTFLYGFDFKYKLFNNITLNTTINPDYGQIELDPEEVNLTAYETFYPEKRQFFLENSSFFDLPIKIFYSRRIGQHSDIKWASKIIAPSYKDFMFSSIIANEQNRFINVSRLEKNILYGNSFLGLTSVISKQNNDENKVFSIDGIFNYLDNKLSLDGQLILSDNSLNSQGTGISLESSYSLNYLKYFVDIEYFDKNLDINELGYLRRNNFQKIKYGFILRDLEPGNFVRSKSLVLVHDYQENIDRVRLKNNLIAKGHLSLMNHFNFEIKSIYSKSHFDDYLTYDFELDQFGAIIPIPSSNSHYFIFESNPLNKISFKTELNIFKRQVEHWGFTDNNNSYEIELTLKPLHFIVSKLSYNRLNIDESLYFLETIDDDESEENPDTHYIFSKRKGYSDIICFRLDGAIDTKTSLQLYTELYKNDFYFNDYRVLHQSDIINNQGFPSLDDDFFNGTGQYDEFPPLYFPSTQDLDDDYLDATYLDPNDSPYFYSQYTNLNINCIFKWEYNDASNFYLVWTYQKGVNGQKFSSLIDFLNYNDIENHNEIYYNNSIHMKIDYWFNL